MRATDGRAERGAEGERLEKVEDVDADMVVRGLGRRCVLLEQLERGADSAVSFCLLAWLFLFFGTESAVGGV